MTIRTFKKVLSAVEVTSKASNQHEFNAGTLRQELGLDAGHATGTQELGLDAGRVTGTLELLCFRSDDTVPITVRTTYTLYDARAASPDRTEWRMYYTASAVEQCARANDLMLVLRPTGSSTDLIAIVARPGTAMARIIGVFD